MRISDWSSDVCSSDLQGDHGGRIYRPILLNYNRIFRCVACLGMELLQRVALWDGRSGTGCDDLGMMDLETVLIVCFAIAGLQALAWIFVWLAWRHLYELRFLAAGFAAIALGLLLMILRGVEPAVWTVVLANIVIKLRSEEHTSELQSLMRISYAAFCL